MLIIESIAENASRYGMAEAIVVCEDTPTGPAHAQARLVISGDLELLAKITEIKPGLKLKIEVVK